MRKATKGNKALSIIDIYFYIAHLACDPNVSEFVAMIFIKNLYPLKKEGASEEVLKRRKEAILTARYNLYSHAANDISETVQALSTRMTLACEANRKQIATVLDRLYQQHTQIQSLLNYITRYHGNRVKIIISRPNEMPSYEASQINWCTGFYNKRNSIYVVFDGKYTDLASRILHELVHFTCKKMKDNGNLFIPINSDQLLSTVKKLQTAYLCNGTAGMPIDTNKQREILFKLLPPELIRLYTSTRSEELLCRTLEFLCPLTPHEAQQVIEKDFPMLRKPLESFSKSLQSITVSNHCKM